MRAVSLVVLLLLSSCTDFDALTRGHEDLGVDAAVTVDAAEDLAEPIDAALAIDAALSCTDVACGGSCPACDVGGVCLVDGDCQTGACISGHCELVSGPPSWLAVGTAPTAGGTAPIARNDLMLGLGPDGALYAMGGHDSSNTTLDTVERLDTTNTWATSSNLQKKRALAGVVSTPSYLAVLYGIGTSMAQQSVESIASTSMFQTQSNLAAVFLAPGAAIGSDGRIYVFGGTDTPGNAITTAQSFLLGDTNLVTVASLGTARARLAAATGSDGRIYAIGGTTGMTSLVSVEAYTPTAPAWVAAASLPAPRGDAPGVLAPDGRIYVPGGANLASSEVYASTVAYRAKTATQPDAWVTTASLASPRWRHGAALGSDGRIYVVAGSAAAAALRTVEAYGPIVTLSSASQPAGGTTTITGSNFATSAAVKVTLGSATGPVIGTGTTDGAGVLTATTATIPPGATAVGTRLYVTDARSRYPVSVAFTITP